MHLLLLKTVTDEIIMEITLVYLLLIHWDLTSHLDVQVNLITFTL